MKPQRAPAVCSLPKSRRETDSVTCWAFAKKPRFIIILERTQRIILCPHQNHVSCKIETLIEYWNVTPGREQRRGSGWNGTETCL